MNFVFYPPFSFRHNAVRAGQRLILAGSVAGLATFAPLAAHAVSDAWKANGPGLWNDAASWTLGNIPGDTALLNSTDVATFGFTLTAGRTVTVDANRNIGGITFSNTSAFGYTLSGGNLRLSNGRVIQLTGNAGGHTDTVSSPIEIQGDGGSATFTNASTLVTRLLNIGAVTGVSTIGNVTTLTLNGTQSPSGVLENAVAGVVGNGSGGGKLAIVKDGAGSWTLSNTANNFTGGTTLNLGILRATTAGALGGGTVTLAGGQLHLINAASTTFGNNVVVTGSTQISATRVSGTGGSATHTLGTLSIGASTFTLGVFGGITGGLIFGNTTLTGDATFATNASTTLTLGPVGGAFSITKTTAGTLVLSGANSYSGATNLNGGTVRISAANNLGDGSATNTLNFNSGGILQSTGNTYALGTNRTVAITGAGTVQVDAGKLTIDGAATGAGALTKTGGGNLELPNASYTGSTLIQNGVLQANNTASNIVLGTVGSATTYGVLGLTANFTGALGTAAGNVSWATGASTSGGFAVMDAATRTVNIGGNVTPQTLTVGTTNFVGGTLTGSNSRIKFGDVGGTALGTVDFQNSINLGSGDRSLIFVVDGAAQYSGKVSGNIIGAGVTAGAGDAVVKFGNANLLLAGSGNTYTGRTVVGGQGSVVLASTGAFSPNTWMHLDAGAAGTLGGILGLQYDLTANLGQAGGNVHFATSGGFAAFGADHSVTLNGGAALTWGTTTSFVASGQNLILGQAKADGALTLTNNIDLGAAARTVFVNRGTASVDGVFSGNLSGTGGGLVKTGAGVLSLTGTNSYTGPTTVNAGTLIVGGDNSASATTVNGGTLKGTGLTGPLTLNTGIIAPGNSPGILGSADLALNGGTLALEIFGLTAGIDYDQLAVTGTVALNGLVGLTIDLGVFDPADDGSQSFTVIDNNSTDAVTYDFLGGKSFSYAGTPLNEGALFTVGAQDFTITYAGGTDSNDVVVRAVPEPGTAISLLSGLGLFLGARRRRV